MERVTSQWKRRQTKFRPERNNNNNITQGQNIRATEREKSVTLVEIVIVQADGVRSFWVTKQQGTIALSGYPTSRDQLNEMDTQQQLLRHDLACNSFSVIFVGFFCDLQVSSFKALMRQSNCAYVFHQYHSCLLIPVLLFALDIFCWGF